jgi:predicted SprT family Zn-dependent metalloprotease
MKAGTSLALEQLEFGFHNTDALTSIVSLRERWTNLVAGEGHSNAFHVGRDAKLERQARELLRTIGADSLAREIRVEWNPRLKTCAGRADYRAKSISLNPLLRILAEPQPHIESAPNKLDRLNRSSFRRAAAEKLNCLKQSSLTTACNGAPKNADRSAVVHDEIDRTLRHELAHLLAQFRAGRRRILPHGREWRQACHDLGIGDEKRCHNLPFPMRERVRRFLYKCPNCDRDFARARRIHRAIACLACCRAHNGGEFDRRFRLKLISVC